MTRSSKASNVPGSSFHLGTTELSRIVIVATLQWISNAPLPMLELFSSRISVDQDISVIVAEIDNDDDVKQRLVSIVFHATVTQQRSSGSKTRTSCPHVHERTNSCPPLQTRVRENGRPHKLMLKAGRTLETRLIVQQCAQQHILPTMFACRPKEGNTPLLNSRQRNQGYQKTWSAQRIQTISKTRILSTLAEHDRGLSIQFMTKTSRSLAK